MSLSTLAAGREVPARPALVDEEGEVVTWGELAHRVRARMEALGADRETLIPLVGETTAETVVHLLTAIEAGRPVLLLHPRWTPQERTPWLAAARSARLPGPAADAEWTLAVVPTSGSSGRPKGVVLSRRAFLASAQASASNLGWRRDDRWLLGLPLAHVGGLSVLVRCLLARRTVVLAAPGGFDPRRLAETVERRRVTLLSLVPTQLRRLIDLEPRWRPPVHLRAVLLGGAAAPAALLDEAAKIGWHLLTTYGLTEACSQVATQLYGTRPAAEEGCGAPLPGMEVRIRGGGIEVRGPSLLSGLLVIGAAGDTARFEQPPLDAEGWLATGDLGHLDAAGRLHVHGRRDEVIVSGGENVHPREVEAVLEDHPAIEAACVFGLDDRLWGETIAAALVSAEPPADRELAAFCVERLAGFRRPRRVAYLAELPLTPSAKLDRRRAAELASDKLREL